MLTYILASDMKLHTGLIAKLFLFLRVLDSVSAASAASEELGVFHPILILITTDTNIEHSDRNDPVYRAALIEECGDLGVLDVPEGQPESEIRHCKEHPRWRDPTFVPDFAALAEKEAKLTAESRRGKRGHTSSTQDAAANIFGRDALACSYGSDQYGCTDGSCWRVCGSRGSWCWLTVGTGNGPWLKCSIASQCAWEIGVCSEGSCGSCGCGCS